MYVNQNDDPAFHEAILTLANGSSGIEIRAVPPRAFNCVEFTLREDVPQPVFISPWMQWEPVEMQEWRMKLANEIARRAIAHDALVAQLASLQKTLKATQQIMDRRYETQEMTYKLWREERAKYGLDPEFRDIAPGDWPKEMMYGYDRPAPGDEA